MLIKLAQAVMIKIYKKEKEIHKREMEFMTYEEMEFTTCDEMDFTTYDGVGDVLGVFTPEFRRYIRDEKLLCHYPRDSHYPIDRLRLGYQIWLFNKEQQLDGVDSAYLDFLNMLKKLALDNWLYGGLVQFWKAEEVTADGEKRIILTPRNQPFLISEGKLLVPNLYTYRMKMAVIVTRNAGEGGVVGRVFWNKRLEFTPNIGYYSYEEYPHKDLALSCNIKSSLVLPLADSLAPFAGVIEIITPFGLLDYRMIKLEIDFVHLIFRQDIRQQYNLHEECFRNAVSEIKEVMKVVGRSLDLVCAQTWMLSNNHESISTSKKIDYRADASYCCESRDSRKFSFLVLEREYTLKKAEGVVGNAATSVHNLVYDVSEFCITEYPLSHYARHCGLTSSFAISLRSDLTGNQIYILEFFLNTNEFNRRDLRDILVPILENMRQNFQTFKVASGEEIGHNLSVLVIDAGCPDKIATLRNGELDLRLAIGVDYTEGCLPYNVPHSIGESSTHETDDPMDGAGSSFYETFTEDTTLVSDSTVQSELRVTVKAKFRGDFFKFQLSSSSGIHGLSQQLFRRLNLEIGTYTVAYQDEDNDWVLVACDEDLHHYILSLTEQGKYTLTIKIEPIEEF